MVRSRVMRVAVLLLACVASLGVGRVASATVADETLALFTDNMFPTANYNHICAGGTISIGFCKTDNRDISVSWDPASAVVVGTSKKNLSKTVLTNEYATQDLNVVYSATPVFSGSTETDIVFQANDGVPSGADGVAWCDDAANGDACDQHYIRIRQGSWTHGLVCHESGHAVGLTHGREASPRVSQTDSRLGCMQTPVGSGIGLGAHNRAIINQTY